jgi:arylsulfatase A-like enzyme
MKALVVVARGLQVGALGCYGNQWIDTPALDGLAAGGIVFDQHFADHADPAGARRAWRSGRYHLPSLSSPESVTDPDLLVVLRAKGIHTCLIIDDSLPSPTGFEVGWDEVVRVTAMDEATPLEATLEAAGAVLERLEKRDDWLLWIDLATPLSPWNVPDEFRQPYFAEEADEEVEEDESEKSEPLTPLHDVECGTINPDDDPLYLSLQTSYAAAVTYLDAGIGQLLEALDGVQGGDDVILLFTSDVGQSLGEHGVVGPVCAWLHEEVVHLPLLMRLPGATSGRRVSALTQAVDVPVTLADWFKTPLADVHGVSLLPLARGETEAIRPYACAGRQVGDAIEYALRTPDWAFLLPVHRGADDLDRAPQLYVKPDDRWEVNDVAQHHLEMVEQFERTLRDFVTASCQPGPLQVLSLPTVETIER